jgi:hypothetical protein
LEVVDCHEDRCVGRECPEDVENREPDRARLYGTVAAGSFDQERRFERASAEFVQRRQHVGCHRAQQLADSGEGKDGFGLDRAVREDARSADPRALQSGLPELGLADPRLSREHEQRRRSCRAFEEVLERADFVLASAEPVSDGHPAPFSRRTPVKVHGFPAFRNAGSGVRWPPWPPSTPWDRSRRVFPVSFWRPAMPATTRRAGSTTA